MLFDNNSNAQHMLINFNLLLLKREKKIQGHIFNFFECFFFLLILPQNRQLVLFFEKGQIKKVNATGKQTCFVFVLFLFYFVPIIFLFNILPVQPAVHCHSTPATEY